MLRKLDMLKCHFIAIFLIAILILASGHQTALAKETSNQGIIGRASWYGKYDTTDPMPHKRNADGSRFNENAFTCAMRHRQFGHYYKVTNLENGKRVIVKHRDYGPARKYRGKRLKQIIDLSKAAFKKIADLRRGVIRVKVGRIS